MLGAASCPLAAPGCPCSVPAPCGVWGGCGCRGLLCVGIRAAPHCHGAASATSGWALLSGGAGEVCECGSIPAVSNSRGSTVSVQSSEKTSSAWRYPTSQVRHPQLLRQDPSELSMASWPPRGLQLWHLHGPVMKQKCWEWDNIPSLPG